MPFPEEEDNDRYESLKKHIIEWVTIILFISALICFGLDRCNKQIERSQSTPYDTSLGMKPTNDYVDVDTVKQQSEVPVFDVYTDDFGSDYYIDSTSTSKYWNYKIWPQPDEAPKFRGGNKALQKWLSEHVVYPARAKEKGIEGQVRVYFVVDPDGSISDVRILKSAGKILDEEAKRVVSEMPNWIPGKHLGWEVRVSQTIPITFSLE